MKNQIPDYWKVKKSWLWKGTEWEATEFDEYQPDINIKNLEFTTVNDKIKDFYALYKCSNNAKSVANCFDTKRYFTYFKMKNGEILAEGRRMGDKRIFCYNHGVWIRVE